MTDPVLIIQASIIRMLHFFTRRKIILVACMPKSGSTYLTNQFKNLAGCADVPFVPSYDRREQELSGSKIFWLCLLLPHKNLIAQHHVRCSQNTLDLINWFDIKTVVLTRNIEDIILSACDHFDNESTVSPMSFWNDELLKSAEDAGQSRFSILFRTMGPWLVNFYLTWKFLAPKLREKHKPIFLKYEDFYSDEALNFALLFKNLQLRNLRSYSSAKDTKTRFNKGQVGRGMAELSKDDAALRAWQDLQACYPTVNFNEPIGT